MSELLTDKKVEDIDNFYSIKPVTAANLSNTLKIYRNLFITWYELSGFHFADIEKYLTHGMIFRFSSAIKQSVSIRLGDKQIAKLMNDITPINLQSDLDLDKNLSHYDLLDTDQNRLKIRKLFHTSFPQSNLLTFNCSENDQNKYVLEFSVYISYEDLENLWAKLYPKEGMR